MQRIAPQAAVRTPVARSVIFLVLVCAAVLNWSDRPANAAEADMRVDDAARQCAALGAMKVPARAFALPTGDAIVTEALLIASDSTIPEYCRVRATTYNLARFVTGLKTAAVSADLSTFVEGRRLDDNVHILLSFEGNARGMLWASQVAVGCENGLQLRVYGEKAGLEWRQDNPNQMWFTEFGGPKQLLTRGGAISGDPPPIQVRLPSGHPEGYLEAFATLYSQFAQLIRSGDAACPDLPSLADGIEGMEFIAAAVRSSNNQSMWTSLSEM